MCTLVVGTTDVPAPDFMDGMGGKTRMAGQHHVDSEAHHVANTQARGLMGRLDAVSSCCYSSPQQPLFWMFIISPSHCPSQHGWRHWPFDRSSSRQVAMNAVLCWLVSLASSALMTTNDAPLRWDGINGTVTSEPAQCTRCFHDINVPIARIPEGWPLAALSTCFTVGNTWREHVIAPQ